MNQISIVLSFDYELPLGGISKSYNHSLFEPTEKLLATVNNLDVPIVLFADILSYIKFKEENIPDYYLPFEKQILNSLPKHDVQLHLHPHWLETKINDNNFKPSPKFKLSDFFNNHYPNNIDGIIKSGINTLESICCKSMDNYKCIAYRAGGYNLNPKTAEIIQSLYDHGIRIDSSISRGYYFKSDRSVIDFTKVPKKPNWYLPLNGNLGITNSDSNSLFEIPIASKPKRFFDTPTKLKMRKYKNRAVESRGQVVHTNTKVGLPYKVRQLLSARMLTVDNHTHNTADLMNILDYNIQQFSNHENIILSLIGHPKSMDNYHFTLLTSFINAAREKYKENIRFVTYRQIYDEMKMK